jgi:hypothetical protein
MKQRDQSLNPLQKCGTISHNEDHLQVLTPKVIDHRSINKIFDQSIQPLCRCVIKSEAIVINRSCDYKKIRSIKLLQTVRSLWDRSRIH